MPLLAAAVTPHPPLIVAEVGRGQEHAIQATMLAYEEVACRIGELVPDTIILISPHATTYADYIHVSPGAAAQGDLSRFGAAQCRFALRYDQELGIAFSRQAESVGFPAGLHGEREPELDHGCTVPLYFIAPHVNAEARFLRLGISGLSPDEHYRCGMLLRESIEQLNRRALLIASGDLSHRLKAEGPYGFAPEGSVFDREVLRALAQADYMSLLNMPAGLGEAAGECGLRSLQIMAGAFDGQQVQGEVLSYEGPYGVGYAVAWMNPGERSEERRFWELRQQQDPLGLRGMRANEDPWVSLARQSLEHRIRTGTKLELPVKLPAELLSTQAGTFVSIRKHDRLRGCIGTITPTQPSLAQEIIHNAIQAGLHDPRFAPVRAEELEQLVYSVDVLLTPELIIRREDLDPQQYGVIVSLGRRRGLLLPMLEGVDTVEQQLSIALEKAGIRSDEDYTIERFRVVRHQS